MLGPVLWTQDKQKLKPEVESCLGCRWYLRTMLNAEGAYKTTYRLFCLMLPTAIGYFYRCRLSCCLNRSKIWCVISRNY